MCEYFKLHHSYQEPYKSFDLFVEELREIIQKR